MIIGRGAEKLERHEILQKAVADRSAVAKIRQNQYTVAYVDGDSTGRVVPIFLALGMDNGAWTMDETKQKVPEVYRIDAGTSIAHKGSNI